LIEVEARKPALFLTESSLSEDTSLLLLFRTIKLLASSIFGIADLVNAFIVLSTRLSLAMIAIYKVRSLLLHADRITVYNSLLSRRASRFFLFRTFHSSPQLVEM
jgi:hypothetical protein